MDNLNLALVFFLILSSSPSQSYSWSWFSSSTNNQYQYEVWNAPIGIAAEFSMDFSSNSKGRELTENAKTKLTVSNSCWQNAYKALFSSCREIISDQEKKSRLAWHLSDCFHKDSGRSPFPYCDLKSPMSKCLKNIDEGAHKVYLEFFLEVNSICHHLQTDAFKHETERLVNDLQKSARYAEEKLETIEERSKSLLQNSNQIFDSLTSIDIQATEVAKKTMAIEDQIINLMRQSTTIFEQSREIVSSQSELQEGNERMRERLDLNMGFLHESHESLEKGISSLSEKAIETQREINRVGESMSSKLQSLQNKADDIGNAAAMSLIKQKQLLDGQSQALEGLGHLTQFQSQALEESRSTLKKLTDFGQEQQLELIHREEQLRQAHDHLIQNSLSILAAQEAFELKQATIFTALDKLFSLHKAILSESRAIKAFFLYLGMMVFIYMITSTKQTCGIRARLYLGLCVIFAMEFAIIRFGSDELDQHIQFAEKVLYLRISFVVIAFVQLLYSVLTFRDYEVLNHQMLLTVVEKLNAMEAYTEKKKLSIGTNNDTKFLSWINKELQEDESLDDDPDYIPILHDEEESVSTITLKTYNLRPRKHN
ncbi:protein GAMETE EXPRESSED 1 [Amborella trichopoda]|uniref:protein GAMETE EXPRESSED 1 n=1 Tax=Amborella trichopoda TaxID=13333 RepID=UPI0005D3CD45|nr:protein GAMETE EXPRESSED 1 [Amborella trichopoda]|eukprot:XP_011625339.1 protein GAMETE EXPRESSED 1 [Amborella trichopoda]